MSASSSPTPPPAVKSYFFAKGYTDLADTLRAAWVANRTTIEAYWQRVGTAWSSGIWGKAGAVAWLAAAIAVILFGSLSTVLLSLVHVTTLAIFFLVIYVLFSSVALFDRGVILVRRLVSVCPQCHARLDLPTYLCDGCGAEHPRLLPSSFGILWHRCRCGKRLPCSFLSNRGRLTAKCPHCGHFLAREHTETRKQFLPIVGGPSAGKTAYLAALTARLEDHVAPGLGMRVEFIDHTQKTAYEAIKGKLARGQTPDKTIATLPRAFDLVIRRQRGDLGLYLYDPAGEAFLGSADLIPHKFLAYLSGIVLLIDPFAFPAVRSQYAAQLPAERGLRPSTAAVDDIVTRLVNVLEAEYGLSSAQKLQVPLAVVINKVDAFDLESRIGDLALISTARLPKETASERRDRLIRTQLDAWGQAALIHLLEERFVHVAYFSISALGHSPDGSNAAFEPRRVEDPALWVLRHSERAWRS